MYNHTFLHTTATICLVLGLLLVIIRGVKDHRAAGGWSSYQSLLLLFAISLMLAGNLMQGGPHDAASGLLSLAGVVSMIVIASRSLRKSAHPGT